jgi:hypothetical protein
VETFFPLCGKIAKHFSIVWKKQAIFSTVWKNIFQTMENSSPFLAAYLARRLNEVHLAP